MRNIALLLLLALSASGASYNLIGNGDSRIATGLYPSTLTQLTNVFPLSMQVRSWANANTVTMTNIAVSGSFLADLWARWTGPTNLLGNIVPGVSNLAFAEIGINDWYHGAIVTDVDATNFFLSLTNFLHMEQTNGVLPVCCTIFPAALGSGSITSDSLRQITNVNAMIVSYATAGGLPLCDWDQLIWQNGGLGGNLADGLHETDKFASLMYSNLNYVITSYYGGSRKVYLIKF